MRREGGFTGTLPPPVPDKPEGISRGHREAAIYRREPGSPGWWRLSHPARSPVMSLQSSKEHKVNGMTTTAVCSPHPNPLPGGARGLLSARINLWEPSALWERAGVREIQPLAATLRKSNTRQALPSDRGMLPQLTIITSVEIPTIDLIR